jgi:hypothetical protein
MRQALELALEALTHIRPSALTSFYTIGDRDKAIIAIKEALAQPEQEPVATLDDLEQEIYENTRQFVSRDVMEWMLKRYYTTPPQRTWVGLTDEEIADCAEKMEASDPTDSFWREFFRGIEAKLKEKNT